jgi:hypothetical protein
MKWPEAKRYSSQLCMLHDRRQRLGVTRIMAFGPVKAIVLQEVRSCGSPLRSCGPLLTGNYVASKVASGREAR